MKALTNPNSGFSKGLELELWVTVIETWVEVSFENSDMKINYMYLIQTFLSWTCSLCNLLLTEQFSAASLRSFRWLRYHIRFSQCYFLSVKRNPQVHLMMNVACSTTKPQGILISNFVERLCISRFFQWSWTPDFRSMGHSSRVVQLF